MNRTLTALNGVRVGHSTHIDRLTGATVVLFDGGVPAVYVSDGGSTGTFNTDALQTGKAGDRVDAMFISGGSWTGLQTGAELMKCLIDADIGGRTYAIVNPNVTGAIVLDLGVRLGRFDPIVGQEAFFNATVEPVQSGNVGAGTGAAVGKFYYPGEGRTFAGMKAGVGCARTNVGHQVVVCAMSVVNAVGNVIAHDGSILAGNRSDRKGEGFRKFEDLSQELAEPSNTTISIVGINVDLNSRDNYARVARIASQGQVRAIDPVNLSLDGDTVFVFSTEEVAAFLPMDAGRLARGGAWPNFAVDIVGQAAARAVRESIYDACRSAATIPFPSALNGVIPSCRDYLETEPGDAESQ